MMNVLFKKEQNPELWKRIKKNSDYTERINLLKNAYECRKKEGIPLLPYSKRKLYYQNGNRSQFEEPYFNRREYMVSCALLALIYPEESQYLDDLQDIIWEICEEYSWVLPAHTYNVFSRVGRVDLFSAETGFALTEITQFLEERLDRDVIERVRREVRKRIVIPYEQFNSDWETLKMNWSAVCVGHVGSTLMYLEPELFKEQLPRILDTIKCFLSGFPEDGCCMEGIDYWSYGFGSFVWFADNLFRFTNGEIDLFEDEKVKKIATYGQKMLMCGGAMVNFADGERNSCLRSSVVDFLHRRYPDAVQNIPIDRKIFTGRFSRWTDISRDFLYADSYIGGEKLAKKDYYLESAGQMMVNRERYSFAVKAGSNNEPHNHNDVGSFILADGSGQVICDIGSGLYTQDYFLDKRYNILCTSSEGHNVPVIDGEYQKAGIQYRGTMMRDGDSVTLQIANAYGIPQLKSIVRKFSWTNDCILLTDTFSGTINQITERMVAIIPPESGDGFVMVGNIKIKYPSEKADFSFCERKHKKHSHVGESEKVFLLNFVLKPGEREISFEFIPGENTVE